MHLESLETTGFRNLRDATVRFDPGLNLVLGANGQGKTNLLEAITVLGTLRSFRTANLRRSVRHGEHRFVLRGTVRSTGPANGLAQEVAFEPTLRRRLLLDGNPVTPAEYLQAVRIEVLTGRREDLVLGEPRVRRAFLDRLAFQLRPATYDLLRSYRRLLAQRNAWLRAGGPGAEGDAWETGLARDAAAVVAVRRRAVERLGPVFARLVQEVGAGRLPSLDLAYRAESWLPEGDAVAELAEKYGMMYHSARERDGRLGFTGYGPHRHDLLVTADGRNAAESLSAGQARLVAALLRLAAVELVEEGEPSGGPGIVVMDDADAELDREAFKALLGRVGRRDRQVILSSPRDAEVRRAVGAGAVFLVRGGSVLPWTDVETTDDG